ncbi:hypothetical protein PLESTF_001013800 [Pleodorina starrii]|nr:hypothetical protein PLESTF_001013800 [Pleodorina starrii]
MYKEQNAARAAKQYLGASNLCASQLPFSAVMQTAYTEQASTSTHDAQLQRLLLTGPPPDFDFRTEVTACSRQWVDEHAPQLRDLVDDGTLVVVPRRPDYLERRTDGYCEPRVVLLVGTAHVSRRSQLDVDRVIRAVVPDSVVVELCKSRSAALGVATRGSVPPAGPDPRVGGRSAMDAVTTPNGSESGSGSDSERVLKCLRRQHQRCSVRRQLFLLRHRLASSLS